MPKDNDTVDLEAPNKDRKERLELVSGGRERERVGKVLLQLLLKKDTD